MPVRLGLGIENFQSQPFPEIKSFVRQYSATVYKTYDGVETYLDF